LKGDGTGSFSIYGDKFPVRSCYSVSIMQSLNDLSLRMKTLKKSTLGQAYCQWYHISHLKDTLINTNQANSGPNSNGCQVRPLLRHASHFQPFPFLQFFITTAPCDFLDGKHVVFGRVIDGLLTLRKIENVATGPNNRPKLAVKIIGTSLGFFCDFEFSCNQSNSHRMRRDVKSEVLIRTT
jgi:peptidyl-prolyl isomerase H (cyclophilin H)